MSGGGPQLSQVYAPIVTRPNPDGADPLAQAPPGVTPSVWAQLSPRAKDITLSRLAQQDAPPEAQPTPPPTPPTGETGILNRIGQGLDDYFGRNGGRGSLDETGGGLRAVTPPGAPKAAPPPPGSVDPSSLHFAQGGAARGAPAVGGFARVPALETPLVDPKRIAGIQAAQGEQANAARDVNLAEQDAAITAGLNAADKAKLLGQQEHETREQAAQQDAHIQGQQEKLAGLRQDLATTKPDSERWYKRKGTAGNIGLALAVGLSEFGNALTHRSGNAVLDMIHSHVANDLDDQRQEIEAKKGAVAGQEGVLADAYRRFGNMNQALNAAHVLALQKAGEEANAYAAKVNSATVNARNAELQAKLKEEQQRGIAALYHYTPAHAVATGGTGGISSKDQGRIFRGPDGQTYVARTEDGRKKLASSSQAVQDVQQLAARYQQQVEQLGAADKFGHKVGVTSEAMAAAQQTRNELLSVVRKAQDDGVWKKSETEMLEQSLGSPDAILSANGPSQAAQIAKQAATAHAHAMAAEDALPVDTGWGRDAKGNLEPRAGYTGQGYQPPAAGPNYRPVQ